MKFNFNFYKILGVSEDVSKKELKKAYRELSKKYHPDNQETGDEELFKKISIAYGVLSNDEKRKLYDLGKWDELEPESEINLSEAEQNVIALFQRSIDTTLFGISGSGDFLQNIVRCICEDLMNEIRNYGNDLIKLEATIGRLKNIIPKVKFEPQNTKHNLLQMAIQQVISLKEQEVYDIKIQLKLAKEMHHIVKDFYFEDSSVLKKITDSISKEEDLLEIPCLEYSKRRRSIGRRF